jgi:DNA-binding HxlR family transcriptional regulator
MKRKSVGDSTCAVARSLDILGDWWSLLILRDAFEGVARFGDFERSLGIPKSRLSVRLKALVANGILEVAPASDGSAYGEYVLTDRGRDLFPVMVGLRQWGERHLFPGAPPRRQLVDRLQGRPISRLEPRSADGRSVGLADTLVIDA